MMARRYVGIDLAKRTMQVCILEKGEIERHDLKTDAKGRQMLRRLLRKTDVVGMEMCCCSVILTREIQKEVGCTVYDLNAGELQIIWKSRKKTDREDALKIAKYVRDTRKEELKTVELPTEAEEAYRGDISLSGFLKKERNQAINRLHSMYAREGITDVTKKDLKDAKRRAARRGELSARLQAQAEILEEQLALFEKQLEATDEKVAEKTRGHELAPYVLSVPGVGMKIAASLLAYLGDGSRFTKAAQVTNYAGLVPSVDCSGDTKHYGPIAKYTYCQAIRGTVLEGVWSLVKSGKENMLFNKYQDLSGRMSKRKSAVAVARKMVGLAWLMLRRRELYRGISKDDFERKMKRNKIRPEKWEFLSDKISERKNQVEKTAKLVLSA
jgi:transposase